MGRKYTDRRRMRNVWYGMIRRCHDPRAINYKYYGAKGITVCDRWKNSFDDFLSDIGIIPHGLTIDRKNNSLGYKPSNVQLSTVTEQNNNKSDTHYITFNGSTLTMTAWANDIGISTQLLHYRLRANWAIEDALTVPVNSGCNDGKYRRSNNI